MKSYLALALCAFATLATAQEKPKPPAVGDSAPAIDLQALLQAPAGAKADWEALNGKVVVLEFWATWCGPCVGAISHMNELTDDFKGRSVQFIAITDEDEPTIKEFLDKKPIHGWVGLNTNQSMLKSYGVEGIPHTVIVGKDGRIAGITHPVALEAKHLENVLAGKEAGLDVDVEIDRPTVPSVKAIENEQPAFFQFIIRPSTAEEQSGTGGSAGMSELGIVFESKAVGLTLKQMLPGAYGVTPSCLFVESPLYEGKLDVLGRMPRDSIKEMEGLGRQVIEATFGLTSRRETREIEVYVLTVKALGAKGFKPTALPKTSYSSFAPGKVEAINVTVDTLIKNWLNHVLQKPVIDETGLASGYDLELKWDGEGRIPSDPTKIIQAVREQLGLELTLTRRPMEVVVVSKKGK